MRGPKYMAGKSVSLQPCIVLVAGGVALVACADRPPQITGNGESSAALLPFLEPAPCQTHSQV